jgi:hypothetical protein
LNICKLSPSKAHQKQVQFNITQDNQTPFGKATPTPSAPDFKQFITASTNAHSAFGFTSSDK